MLQQPKNRKFSKSFKGRNKGIAHNGNKICFGEYAIKATTCCQITAKQIEATRKTISRNLKKRGKLFIRVFPDKPVTKKPLEVRQGKGKGNVEYWVSKLKPGKILFEISGIKESLAKKTCKKAASKLPFKVIFIKRGFI